MAFSGEVESGARVVVENAVLVGGDALVDVGHPSCGGSVPCDFGPTHAHFDFVMGADAFVAVTKSLHVFELNADPFSVDVESVVRRVFRRDVTNDDV